VRTSAEPHGLIGAIRREVAAAAPQATYVDVRPLIDLVEPKVRPWRLGATMFTVFGALALVLAAVGLYSVMAYSVTQRTPEIGVRIALGAEQRHVAWLLMRRGLTHVAIGLILGLAGAFALSGVLQTMLVQVTAGDPLTFAGVAIVLTVVAIAACLVPVRRATRIDPVTALRSE
jgi:ABC-type antimicrobial peptide transport system permease subunit